MAHEDVLIGLERDGWDALSAGGDVATAHYAETLAAKVVFLLPGGMILDDRAQVISSMGGDPWSSYELSDERVIELTDDVGVVAYRARATRDDSEYAALINSTYVRHDGEWKLAVHQQTPM